MVAALVQRHTTGTLNPTFEEVLEPPPSSFDPRGNANSFHPNFLARSSCPLAGAAGLALVAGAVFAPQEGSGGNIASACLRRAAGPSLRAINARRRFVSMPSIGLSLKSLRLQGDHWIAIVTP